MRVGIVCPYDLGEPGGVQQLTTELVRHLEAGGDSAVLIGPGRIGWEGGPGFSDDTIRIGRSVKVSANQSRVPLTLAPMAFSRIKKELADVDVVHLHEPMVPVAGWAALRSTKPVVATFHAAAPNWVDMAYRFAPFVGTRMRAAVLTAVSRTARRSVPSRWGDVRIIPNAIDVASFDLPVGRVDHRIAFLGRDDPRKGLDIALEAFASVRENHPESKLVVMGSDRALELPGVSFLGRVTEGEKRRTLASSAIYVAPNTGGESFGIVVAEAMAAGCAVVASDIDAFKDVVGEHGVLFPMGDSAALARSITDLLDDETGRRRLAEGGRAAVRSFDWTQILQLYRSAYAEAIASG